MSIDSRVAMGGVAAAALAGAGQKELTLQEHVLHLNTEGPVKIRRVKRGVKIGCTLVSFEALRFINQFVANTEEGE